jgi:hypothetical protein
MRSDVNKRSILDFDQRVRQHPPNA